MSISAVNTKWTHQYLSPKEKITLHKQLVQMMHGMLSQKGGYSKKAFDDAYEEAKALDSEIAEWKKVIHDEYYS